MIRAVRLMILAPIPWFVRDQNIHHVRPLWDDNQPGA
jgi:hypothetical protein